MSFLFLWGGLWVALIALALFAAVVTPTTVVVPNAALVGPLLWTGAASLFIALFFYGAFSLIESVFT